MFSKRSILSAVAVLAMTLTQPVFAGWQDKYPVLNLGVITSENEALKQDISVLRRQLAHQTPVMQAAV
jgi:hypothetical protein